MWCDMNGRIGFNTLPKKSNRERAKNWSKHHDQKCRARLRLLFTSPVMYSDARNFFSGCEIHFLNMRKWYLQLNIIVDWRLRYSSISHKHDFVQLLCNLQSHCNAEQFVNCLLHWFCYGSKKAIVICQTRKSNTSDLNWDQWFFSLTSLDLVRKFHTENFYSPKLFTHFYAAQASTTIASQFFSE